MDIVMFVHPEFLGSQSMPRFAQMLSDGFVKRGHSVATWCPKGYFHKLPAPIFLKKWLGYLDQYVLFPAFVKAKLSRCSTDTLFVFADQALGPWVPLVSNRPHVVHCHDFLAQHSALGQIRENSTGWSGRLYQAFIRRGYSKGRNFISVSHKTKIDLHEMLPTPPSLSTVVYNGLNPIFMPGNTIAARSWLSIKTGLDLSKGYILHVGGNQWYKNRKAVIAIYSAWRSICSEAVPLLMVGAKPSRELATTVSHSSFIKDIHFFTGWDDEAIVKAYQGASVFLFPSLAEGFGWPIAEAMACGCPVVTTSEAPMTEVGADAALYISRQPNDQLSLLKWAGRAARLVEGLMNSSPETLQQIKEKGLQNAARFDRGKAVDKILHQYQLVLHAETGKSPEQVEAPVYHF